MSFWHRNKLNPSLLLSLSREITSQLTAVPSHLPQYLFIDFMLKTSQLQKKFFLGKNAALSGKTGVLLL